MDFARASRSDQRNSSTMKGQNGPRKSQQERSKKVMGGNVKTLQKERAMQEKASTMREKVKTSQENARAIKDRQV